MKKTFIILFTALSIFSINAQTGNRVGINTTNPKGTLHIHSNSSDANGSNDVIVTDNGSFGIGTTSPTKKLDVIGNTIINKNDNIEGNVNVPYSITEKTFRVGGDNIFPLNTVSLEVKPSSGAIRKEALHLRDNTNISNKDFIPVASVRSDGMLEWVDLPQLSDVKIGSIQHGIEINPADRLEQPIKVSNRNITLTAGKWLVMTRAGVSADTPRNNGTSGYMNVWMYLASPDLSTIYDATGVYPEQSGLLVSGPQMFNLITVDEGKTVVIDVFISTSIRNPFFPNINGFFPIILRTDSKYSDLTFMAVKID